MKSYYEYHEKYNVEGYKFNELNKRISFDAVAYIEQKKLNNRTTNETPYIKVVLNSGVEVDISMSEGDRFIKEYDMYQNFKAYK